MENRGKLSDHEVLAGSTSGIPLEAGTHTRSFYGMLPCVHDGAPVGNIVERGRYRELTRDDQGSVKWDDAGKGDSKRRGNLYQSEEQAVSHSDMRTFENRAATEHQYETTD